MGQNTTNEATGKQRVLNKLATYNGEWISSDHLYETTKCMVHSRIADLRRDGHNIQHEVINGKHGYRLIP